MSTNNCGTSFNNEYWKNGMSSIATDGNRNTNFAGNWSTYNNVEYDLSNPDSQLSSELAQMTEFIQGNNPQAAIIFFIQDFSQISMAQSQDGINEMSDQENDLANVTQSVAYLKEQFNNSNNSSESISQDNANTAKFLNELKSVGYHLKTDDWLSGLDHSVKGVMQQIYQLVGQMSLCSVWGSMQAPLMYGDNENNTYIYAANPGQTMDELIFKQFASFLGNLSVNGSNNPYSSPPSVGINQDGLPYIALQFSNNSNYTFFAGEAMSQWNQFLISGGFQQNLQTVLTGFDTLNSATGTLTNQYQSQAQYQVSSYQEKGSFVADIQGDVVQANNSINSNIQPAA